MTDWPSSEQLTSAPSPPSAPPVEPPAKRRGPARWVALVVFLALLFGAGFGVTRWAMGSGSSSTPQRVPSAQPTDPASSVLPSLVLQQSDVTSAYSVQLLRNGTQLSGQATLDLCNGKYPSEAHRSARLQDAMVDTQGASWLSTEAVLYPSASRSAQAFSELRSVAASCPSSPVPSPVGEPTVTTRFNAPPDGSWPQTPTVVRQAYSFTTTNQSGQSTPGLAVYLRRGRALMGVYFTEPTAAQQPPVKGQTSIPAIVSVLASRLAQLPASTVGP